MACDVRRIESRYEYPNAAFLRDEPSLRQRFGKQAPVPTALRNVLAHEFGILLFRYLSVLYFSAVDNGVRTFALVVRPSLQWACASHKDEG